MPRNNSPTCLGYWVKTREWFFHVRNWESEQIQPSSFLIQRLRYINTEIGTNHLVNILAFVLCLSQYNIGTETWEN